MNTYSNLCVPYCKVFFRNGVSNGDLQLQFQKLDTEKFKWKDNALIHTSIIFSLSEVRSQDQQV